MINRIAAGEVVERPASVVKELLENALDAGSTRIEVATAAGGLSLIRVTDDGVGIERDELALAVERHCTSKLDRGLDAIATLGFRGEALASIGSVARLTLRSKRRGEAHGWEVSVERGEISGPRPSPIAKGTQVEVTDLFFATPARLKFMRSERAETTAIAETVRQAAMAHPEVRFALSGPDRTPAEFGGGASHAERLRQVLGRDFADNAIAIEAVRDNVRLHGYVSLPTYNRGNATRQYFFVNGRPVRDRQLLGALRAAYADFLSRDRHPVAALFIETPGEAVDVNVHPAKAEVRFRDPGLVRGLIVGALREALTSTGHRSSTTGGEALQSALAASAMRSAYRPPQPAWRPPPAGFAETDQAELGEIATSADFRPEVVEQITRESADHPLGAARAQLHENYIIAQTRDGLVLVDQHAAHERLVYERLKAAIEAGKVPTQLLLVPEVVELSEDDVGRLLARADELAAFGLGIEPFGPGAIAIREVPAMLDSVDVRGLVNDLVDELAETDSTTLLRQRLDKVAGTIACHGSVRSGRRMRPEEMDALLRQMEATPHSGQCIHGRPTYIELKLADIEKLFGRR